MRKATIIKYEKEFLAWCKGDSVLLGAPTSMHDKALIWREVRDFSDWKPLDTVYVLNDSYSDYRKALAEGKTLQYNFGNYGINKKDFPDSWKDLDLSIGILADRTCPENYRIKPEEPKFKVGDWVRDGKNIYKFIEPSSTYSYELSLNRCELWQPQLGEWCWFYDGRSYDTPCLRKFITIIDDIYIALNSQNSSHITPTEVPSFERGISDSYVRYKNCEPFIGQLPTILKE